MRTTILSLRCICFQSWTFDFCRSGSQEDDATGQWTESSASIEHTSLDTMSQAKSSSSSMTKGISLHVWSFRHFRAPTDSYPWRRKLNAFDVLPEPTRSLQLPTSAIRAKTMPCVTAQPCLSRMTGTGIRHPSRHLYAAARSKQLALSETDRRT